MYKRTKRGSAAIEGVVGLWLVVLGVVFGTLLMVNVAGVTYYKEKVGFIANQAADSTRTVVTLTDITVALRPAVKVTITTPFSTFLSKDFSTVIPSQITLSDSAVAVSNGWYPAYGVVQCPTGAQFLGVMINNTGALPPDGMPAYLISIFGQWKTR
jgi:hypothetical protein